MASKLNKRRALVCNRVKDAGYPRADIVAEKAGCSLTQVADVLLKLEKLCVNMMLGGQAKFTGNTRVFKNGAVASEIRCAKCGLIYWETGLPYALCVDCRR